MITPFILSYECYSKNPPDTQINLTQQETYYVIRKKDIDQ